MNENNIAIMKRHFDPSLSMLRKMIDACPDNLWTQSAGGFPFWQQIYHTLQSIDYWISADKSAYQLPDFRKQISYELGEDSLDFLTKDEITGYFSEIERKVNHFFNRLTTAEAPESVDSDEYTLWDILLVQIRHVQYHVGYCNSILREKGLKAVPWIGYRE